MDDMISETPGLTVKAYRTRKNLDGAQIRKWGVVTVENEHTGEPCVALPYYNVDGELHRTKYRTATGTFWDGQEGVPMILYGLQWLKEVRTSRPVLLVEGESDCHAAWTHKVLALGLPGCQTWQPGWAIHFQGRPTFVWREPGGPDMDGKVPSTKMLERVAVDLPDARVIHPPPGIKDLCDLHLAEKGNFDSALQRLMSAAVPIRDVVIPKPKPSKVRVWRDSSRRVDPFNRDHLDVDKAKSVPLDQLMRRLGFELKRRGREYSMCCPFHEDRNPSLRINSAKGLWRCDPCDLGGDSISFMQKWQGLSFPDAVRAVGA